MLVMGGGGIKTLMGCFSDTGTSTIRAQQDPGDKNILYVVSAADKKVKKKSAKTANTLNEVHNVYLGYLGTKTRT